MEPNAPPPNPSPALGFSPDTRRILQDGGVSPVWFQAQILDHLDRLQNARMRRLIETAQPTGKSHALRAAQAAPGGRGSARSRARKAK